MSTGEGRTVAEARVDIGCARDAVGRFAPAGTEALPKTKRDEATRKRRLNERDYLNAIVAEVGRDDVARIARQIVADAEAAEDTDVKVVNAAREWIGKYLLGNARVSLDDCERQPAIVKRK